MAEKSSDDVAKCDRECARLMKVFVDSLPTYVKERSQGPVIPKSDMLDVPGKKFKMQRFEVTQMQWMIVMGDNPSIFKGPDYPVENMSADDCKAFIERISAMDGVRYRLPHEDEWEYVCRAGSKGDWGRRKNGEEGPFDAMGWNPASRDNNNRISNPGHHAVGLKESNQWGFYDMHGNVGEVCIGRMYGHDGGVSRGGREWMCDGRPCTATSKRWLGDGWVGLHIVGFRLLSSQD